MDVDNKTYETLFSKYNILVSNYQSLYDLHNAKKAEWDKEREQNKIIETNMKKLCESILNKEHQAGNLGKNPLNRKASSMFETINQAEISYNNYIEEKNKLLVLMQKKIEELTDKNLSLIEQINRAQTNGYIKEEVVEEKPEEVGIKYVAEEDMDADVGEELEIIESTSKMVMDRKDKKKKFKATPSSIPSKPSERVGERVEKAKSETKKYYTEDLTKIKEAMKGTGETILDVIGTKGSCTFEDISAEVLKVIPDIKDAKIRTFLKLITNSGVLEEKVISTGFTPKLCIYAITDKGAMLYEEVHKKAPVMSLRDKIVAEHDNLEHGYGIIQLAKIIEQCPKNKEVNTFNRANALKLPANDRIKYVPDIMYKREVSNSDGSISKSPRYIEYERGNHGQEDWNRKCNKIIHFTRYIMVVCDNKTSLETVSAMTKKWAENRGADNLKNIKVKLSTGVYYRDNHLADDEEKQWLIEYDFNSATPYEPKSIDFDK